MRELTPPHLAVEFEAYVETAIRAESGRIEDYYLARPDPRFWVAEENVVLGMVGIERQAADAGEVRRILSTSELQVAAMRLYEANGYRLERKESAAPASHKSVGAGLARYHYEKAMA
jgi:hypothetical protein